MNLEAEAAIFQRLGGLINVGPVCAVDPEGRSLVKVDLGGELESDWIPLAQISTPTCAVWVAPKIGEQVMVLSPGGEAGRGVALRGIYWKGRKEPSSAGAENAVVEFSDGTRIEYDPGESELTLDVKKGLTIKCRDANVVADSVTVTARTEALVDAPKIKLGKNATAADAVVTASCPCMFGTPHPKGSSSVFAQV